MVSAAMGGMGPMGRMGLMQGAGWWADEKPFCGIPLQG